MRPRAPPRVVPPHRRRVGGVASGTSLPQCGGPASKRGRERARCPLAVRAPRAFCPRGPLGSSPRRCPRSRSLGGVPVAASESQCPDDLVRCVQRRRSGAPFAWALRLRHCCFVVPESRGWNADPLSLSRACSSPFCCTCRGRVWVGGLERWLRGLLPGVAPWAPLGAHSPPQPACRLWGGQPVPSSRGVAVAFRRYEGRLVSGAGPSFGRSSLGAGSASKARCLCALGDVRCTGDPAPALLRVLLRAGVACRGGEGGRPTGEAHCAVAGVVRGLALIVPRPPALDAGRRDPSPLLWVRAWGPGTVPLVCMPCRVRGDGGWRPSRGMAFCRCEGRLASSAVPLPASRHWGRAARARCPCVPGTGGVAMGDPAQAPQRALLQASVACCGGGRRAPPAGGDLRRCEGRLRSGAPPAPAACHQGGLLGPAARVLWARACGRGSLALFPWLACPTGGCVTRGLREAAPGVGGLLPAAHHSGRAARTRCPCVPGTGGVGMGGPAPAAQRALLRSRGTRCGSGGGASPWGVPCAVARGVWGQALSLTRLPVLEAGCQGPLPTFCGGGFE